MTARLPSDLLARPAEESARLLALAYLDEIALAERRLGDPEDGEALHDFRVGLRRLRSCSRAYRRPLKGSVGRRARRRLQRLTQATNAGRDAEVQLTWLHHQADQLTPGDLPGLSWLIGRVEGRRFDTVRTATDEARRRFVKMADKLRPRLVTFRMEIRTGPGQEQRSFGRVTAELIRAQVAELASDLKRVQGAEDAEVLHTTRISAKRLRYLLEPLARRTAGARSLVTQLKEIQETLGDLHDKHVIAQEIVSTRLSLSSIGSDRLAEVEPGLSTLERLAGYQAIAAYSRFEALWGGEHAGRFILRVEKLAATLAGPKQALPTRAADKLPGRLQPKRSIPAPAAGPRGPLGL